MFLFGLSPHLKEVHFIFIWRNSENDMKSFDQFD